MSAAPQSELEQLIAAAVTDAIAKRLPTLAAVGLSPRRYALAPVAALIYGYTEGAVNKKMDSGTWRRGHEWILAPDGRRFVDFDAVDLWIQHGKPRE